jgi:predicted negative regulator of RcsB-dependent stress response
MQTLGLQKLIPKMEHGEVTHVKGFGHNTNGVGILIVTIVAVCLALFCWNFWKDASRETDLYRLNSQPTHSSGHDHEQGEKPGVTEASKASTTVEASSSTNDASKVDTLANATSAADTSKHADSTHH